MTPRRQSSEYVWVMTVVVWIGVVCACFAQYN